MFGLGTTEIVMIAGAAIVVFGARRLPEIGSALGKGFRNFRKTLDGKDEKADAKKDSQESQKQAQ